MLNYGVGLCGKPKISSDLVFKRTELSKNLTSIHTVFRRKRAVRNSN